MSTVLYTDSVSIKLRSDIGDSTKDNEATRTREFRVVSGTGLAAYQLLEFAETPRELGAHEPTAKRFRISADTDPGRSPTRLVAEWHVDLPPEVE